MLTPSVGEDRLPAVLLYGNTLVLRTRALLGLLLLRLSRVGSCGSLRFRLANRLAAGLEELRCSCVGCNEFCVPVSSLVFLLIGGLMRV